MVAQALVSVDPRSRHREPRLNADDRRVYEPRGGARELFFSLDAEVLLDGPAGTGKSLAALKRLDRNAVKYPGSRQLIVRKTRTSLTQTALVTFEKFVINPGGRVRFHTTQQAYLYPNGSKIVVGGLDKDSKVMSSEYDTIYVMEATEVTENDWEALTTRLRNGVIPHQQLIADCNPGPPTHWLNQRCLSGKTRRILSRHVDNPALIDQRTGKRTPFGEQYLSKLDALSGVRRARLYEGRWVAAEGQVYEGWDAGIHLIDRKSLPGGDVPKSWSRSWVIDFGYVNPFVWQWWAEDPDGSLYLYREIYMTQRLVTEHAAKGLMLSAGDPRPTDVITDHDAEDRATFEKATGVRTKAAHKAVSPGIQAVANRLKLGDNGKPRLFILRDALVEVDTSLREAGKPTCTADEWDAYVWDTRQNRRKGEEPLKANDHGMDAVRYRVAHSDIKKRGGAYGFS